MRRFNVTGPCIPEEDYMVDISGKILRIRQLIDRRCYFTINKARQYGKTTTLATLERAVQDEYAVASISFSAVGDKSFESEEAFCEMFTGLIQEALQFSKTEESYANQWTDDKVTSFLLLNRHIRKMCRDKKVILMIDEVDNASNNRIFVQFLNILREKYIARRNGRDYTFYSVILAGVYDIRNIKLKMINEGKYTPVEKETKIYNSPWNIAADFTVDMSFNPEEIGTMLKEYEAEHNTGMNISAISEEIYSYTSGYPFMVSRICRYIDETPGKDCWTVAAVQNAVKMFLAEKNVLFDDLLKNLENNKDLYDLIYDVLITGTSRIFSFGNPTIDIGYIYGIIESDKQFNRVAISNRIYEIRLADYFISKDEASQNKKTANILQRDVVRDGEFDMELCLRKFADHYGEIYNKTDKDFLERHGRLLFLSYLKPLINGQGFYHIESQLTDLRRMDIVVDFGRQQFIIELKLWNGQAYQAEAYKQLCGYLKSKHAEMGYLLTFDFREEGNKERKAEWIEVEGRRIFDVMV